MIAGIRKLSPEIELPKYQTLESAGFDIACSEDMVIKAGEVAKIPTGLVIAAPKGHFLLIAARSSLPTRKGLTMANGIGVVDADYAGPNDLIHIIVFNFTKKDVEVKKGERLAQGIFLPVEQAQWKEVNELRDKDRGGIGSTGGYV
jgi:dUTP pyrophosphatase